jgi:hypothetical protein
MSTTETLVQKLLKYQTEVLKPAERAIITSRTYSPNSLVQERRIQQGRALLGEVVADSDLDQYRTELSVSRWGIRKELDRREETGLNYLVPGEGIYGLIKFLHAEARMALHAVEETRERKGKIILNDLETECGDVL